MTRTTRIIGGILGALFILFAGWQFNDPDPAIWVTIYGVSALICFAAAAGYSLKYFYPVVIAACVIGAVLLWPQKYEGISLSAGYKPGIEEARESMGLGIIALANLILFVLTWKNRR